MSSITATLAPTDAPSYEGNFSYLRQNMMWMLLWFTTMVVFIILPFCTSKRRREACARGIRERRWISQEEFDAEEFNLIETREQDSRRQQRENTQRHFQITKTQEDEIRHQYLSYIMEDYTMVSCHASRFQPSCKVAVKFFPTAPEYRIVAFSQLSAFVRLLSF